MNKIKILTVLVGILALINIGLLAFFLIGKSKDRVPRGNRGSEKTEMQIQNNFGFDEAQMGSFRKSKKSHQCSIKILDDRLRELSILYYTTESIGEKEVRDSLLEEINIISESIYISNVKHFDDVRALCKPEQLHEMENFIKGLVNRGKRDRRRRK